MESDTIQDSQSLAPQLAEVRAKLDGLLTELRAAEAELATLAPDREQHGLLADACGALEKLRETGGAGLFWGGRDAAAAGEDMLRRARGRADAFGKRLGAIEDRRRGLIERIREHEFEAGLIEDDLFEAQEEEELRKLDWIIERELKELPARELVMPWTRRGEDDRRYRKSLAVSLLVCLALAVLFPLIDLPLPDPTEVVELPDRVVRMMTKERPRPPSPAREVEPPKPEEQKLAQQPVEKSKPTRPEEIDELEPAVVEAAEPEPEQGYLAFREKLASFKQSRVSDRIGLKPGVMSADETAAGRPERAMLTSNAPGSSGGINLAAYSRNAGAGGAGGGGMKGVQVGRATSAIAGIGGGGGDRPLARGGPGLSRTDEEIQIVFDRYKAAFYRLYNRELRKDPTLRGQLVLRLTIEPDGSVSMCMLQSSDMDAPELSAQVVDRVRTINFGAKPEVQALTIVYPIDFLPAA
jgi:outer membrane biosynthesis protein TonB